jgi:2,3-bisphosphoglycerate-independent phosphoglycerate mutase
VKNKAALIILDGWGIGDKSQSDAIYHAQPSFFNSLLESYPNSTLTTFGNAVGLPKGQMGNSEVGHINLGAGRVVWQMLEKINKAFRDQTIGNNEILNNALSHHESENIHLMGLVSDGGVHSSLEHILMFIPILRSLTNKKIFVHAFLDGRDTDPQSGITYIAQLQKVCKEHHAEISSIIGRYDAMDRDQRWNRTYKAYKLLVHGDGMEAKDPVETVKSYYQKGITDEFMEAIKIQDNEGNKLPNISEGDLVFNLNFRTDRPRQITEMLVERDFEELGSKALKIDYVAMTRYDATFKNIQVLFEDENVINTLGEYLSKNDIKQLRAAETEKYPHVTFFFNGGREMPFEGESREMAASPKVATYDLKPEMSAYELTEKVLPYLSSDTQFICLNYANADMVGHTGDYKAIQKATLAVDACLQKIITEGLDNNWDFIIIADHGNADFAINKDGTPNTQHSLNPVPCIHVSKQPKEIKNGKLADIAPSLLSLLQLPIPEEMDGLNLFRIE